MKKHIFIIIPFIALITMTSCDKTSQRDASNPFFSEFQTPFETPPFDKIKPEHFLPAFKAGIEEQNAAILAIIENPDSVTFENTIVALDRSADLLTKVCLVFYGLENAESTEELRTINKEISPLLSVHQDEIYLNKLLFEKVKSVHENADSTTLNMAQKRLTDKYYRAFVRSGINLPQEAQNRLKEINKQLSELFIDFGDHVLAETNDFKIVVKDENELAGLPEQVKKAASDLAKTDTTLTNAWAFNLQRASFTPVLQYAENRGLREKIYKAYINRGDNNNKNDNKDIIQSIVKLRGEKAELLGFDNFANFKLDEMMAKNAVNVYNLLNDIWKYALPAAKTELAEMQKIADSENAEYKLEAWDWWYYAEKLRKQKFALDDELLRPYFELEQVKQGVFMVANKLFGISFSLLDSVPVYHPEVNVYEVKDADGSHLGVFYTDYFPRPGKGAGAWMGNFREQYVENSVDIRPIVFNVANFTRPTDSLPSLLTLEEVQTLFHEFGHALHGLLSKCGYAGISGTNVARDFVELPSQLMEHWATHPDVLKLYAKHYSTGEIIPNELIDKIQQAAFFNQGFATTELVAAALLDMDWHTDKTAGEQNVDDFENNVRKRIGLFPEITFRYRSTNFNHIFSSDGYAAGYYSYLWSETLDADAFELFSEQGVFDQITATAYRQNILERGDSEDPMLLYTLFRGAAPNPESLLKNRGLR